MGDNPFSALLNPDKQGTITGFLGGALGYPTASQAAGGATGDALKALSDLRAQGQTPQQAIIQFLQTPQGKDYFVQAGPDGLKQLTEGLQATVPPTPAVHTVAPGGQLFQAGPDGKMGLVATNPKEQANTVLSPGQTMVDSEGKPLASVPEAGSPDVVKFKQYAQIAGLPQQEIQRLAAMQIDPSKTPTEKATAIQKLVTDYGLDQRTGQAMLAGAIQVIPQKDSYGNTTGDVTIIDTTNPQAVQSIKINPNNSVSVSPVPGLKATPNSTGIGPSGTFEGASAVSPSATPGITPASGAGTGVLPASKADPTANKQYFGDKADMFLGAGLVAHAVGAASKVGETISPELISKEGAKANDRQTQLAHLTNTLLSMGEQGNGFGINKSIINSFKDLLPSADSLTETPHAAIQKGIRLLQKVQIEIGAEEGAASNSALPQSERVASAKRAEGWRRVERALPTMEQMDNMEKAIRNGTAGALNVESGAKAIIDQGGKAVNSGKKQVQGVTDAVTSETGSDPFANMNEQQLTAINPRSLGQPALVQYRNRIRALIAKGGANGGK